MSWGAWRNHKPAQETVVGGTHKRRSDFAQDERGRSRVAQDTGKEMTPYAGSQTPLNGCGDIYLPVTPCPKPRMTQRDRWKTRPAVVRYRQFCDAVRDTWPVGVTYPEAGAHVTFWLPMPRSWSKRKRDTMRGQPHQQKPDRDNLEKALMDAMCEDDAHVWDGRTTKRWADTGYITITTNEG